MKCPQCGAPISIEDEYCNYCGALNQAARQHQADMKKYNREFESTRATVLSNAAGQIRAHSQLAALGVVILLNIIVIVCLANGYELADWWEERQINRNADAYVAELTAYEEAGDYRSMKTYYSRKDLFYAKRGSELADFDTVCTMAGYYGTILDDFYYLEHPDVASYYTQGELLDCIAENYVYFEEQMSLQDNEYYVGEFSEGHLAAMEDMEDRINAMFQTYGCLTEEDMAGLPDMESQDLMILLGRRMGIYE